MPVVGIPNLPNSIGVLACLFDAKTGGILAMLGKRAKVGWLYRTGKTVILRLADGPGHSCRIGEVLATTSTQAKPENGGETGDQQQNPGRAAKPGTSSEIQDGRRNRQRAAKPGTSGEAGRRRVQSIQRG
jgi:hypothetical protein